MSTSWQRVASIAMILGTACVAMMVHQETLAATLVGMAGGLALPPVQSASSVPALKVIAGSTEADRTDKIDRGAVKGEGP